MRGRRGGTRSKLHLLKRWGPPLPSHWRPQTPPLPLEPLWPCLSPPTRAPGPPSPWIPQTPPLPPEPRAPVHFRRPLTLFPASVPSENRAGPQTHAPVTCQPWPPCHQLVLKPSPLRARRAGALGDFRAHSLGPAHCRCQPQALAHLPWGRPYHPEPQWFPRPWHTCGGPAPPSRAPGGSGSAGPSRDRPPADTRVSAALTELTGPPRCSPLFLQHQPLWHSEHTPLVTCWRDTQKEEPPEPHPHSLNVREDARWHLQEPRHALQRLRALVQAQGAVGRRQGYPVGFSLRGTGLHDPHTPSLRGTGTPNPSPSLRGMGPRPLPPPHSEEPDPAPPGTPRPNPVLIQEPPCLYFHYSAWGGAGGSWEQVSLQPG